MLRQPDLIPILNHLSSCDDLAGIMTVIKTAARRVTGADGITVVLRDKDQCHYADEDAISPLWKGKRFPMSACISGWCMIHRQQVVIADIYADARIPHDAYRPTFVKSLAMTPIRSENPIGAIGAYWATQHPATKDELAILQALGDAAATAMQNVQLIQALKDSNRRKDEFLSMLAHELRNPLGPVRNAIHILKMHGNTPEASDEALGMMDRQIHHMSRIIDDLLDVARITSGKMAVQATRLDLSRVVRQCAEDRRAMLESAGLTLRVELPETPVWISGDSTRLEQVVGNLLDNARKFTPDGGHVTVELDAGDPKSAVVKITDTGIGMETAMLGQLFEAFSQADRSLDRSPGGLGLGLSLARGLLELHGGTIQAQSDGVGKGSVLTIRLPRKAELPALNGSASGTAAGAKKARVLVVEDNLDAARSLRMLLKLKGYDVTLAHTGPDGLAAAKSARPDVVLCDIGLPGMDGYAVAKAIRDFPDTAATRLIAVTGYGDDEDRRRSKTAGFDVHLVKPVDPEALLSQLAA